MPPTPLLILDGGLGTTLQSQFHAPIAGPTSAAPLWSSHLLLSAPATLLAAHAAFAAAGADILLTATYQASLDGFARTIRPTTTASVTDRGAAAADAAVGVGVGVAREEAERYMRSAVGIARAAFGTAQAAAAAKAGGGGGGEGEGAREGEGEGSRGSVALSLGAYGAVMVPSQEYTGRYDGEHESVGQLREWHKARLDVFAECKEVWADVDMVAFETVPLLAEIQAVRQAMAMMQKTSGSCGSEKPFWISCVFPGSDLCLPDGSAVDDVVQMMLSKQDDAAVPFAIGINCTRVGKVRELVKEFEAAVKRLNTAGEIDYSPALVLYPDGTKGEVYNTTTHEWEMREQNHDLPPWDQTMFDIVQNARNSGQWSVIIAGGCCQTTPDDIKNLRRRFY